MSSSSSSSSGSGLEGGAYRSGRGGCPDRRRPAPVRRGARISGGSGSSSGSSSGCCRLGASLSPRGPPHPRGSNSGSEDGARTNRSVPRRRGAAAAAAAAAAASGTAAAAGIAGATGGTSRVGRRGAAGRPRLSSAVEHSEDLGSVEEQLEYRRQAGWVEGWEEQNNGVAGAVGQKVGQKAGGRGAVSLSDSDARRLQELAEAAAAGGGLPERNPRATAQLRRACGDPLFFEHLKESIGDRQRDGKKFLTHEEEMDLGTKVQRYRRLTEVRVVWVIRSVVPCIRSVIHLVDRLFIRSVISFSRPVGRSGCWPVRRSVARSCRRPLSLLGHLVSIPAYHSVGRPRGRLTIHSVGHSFGRPFGRSFSRSCGRSMIRSIIRVVIQSVDYSVGRWLTRVPPHFSDALHVIVV